GGELVAVHPLTGQRHEQSPGLRVPAVEIGRTGDRQRGVTADGAADRGGDLSQGHRDHTPDPARGSSIRASSRGPGGSSPGTTPRYPRRRRGPPRAATVAT